MRRVQHKMLNSTTDVFSTNTHEDGPIPSDVILQINVNLDTKVMSLEVSLLLLIILGRWFLPKGTTSRSNLSQLLLVYMSLSSDIVDLLTIFNEEEVLRSHNMLIATLSVLSWSLFQFPINMTSTRTRTQSSINSKRPKKKGPRMFILYPIQQLFANESWYIYEMNLMSCSAVQLALRLVAVIKFNVRSYSTIFFTAKNGIILFLQLYRLLAILTEKEFYDDGPLYMTDDQQEKGEDADRRTHRQYTETSSAVFAYTTQNHSSNQLLLRDDNTNKESL
ncbi:unnamed protein product [Didymodactylos carnosus]|uniref:Uncharacterized protein n=1 Tax=Didymodactylos carnosus TaxID=1234261 RepID=A0A814ZZX5_9BILA|nr:unnamed protein product [Didymodactylos carnosus]CAF1248240.1 unnamed protein product [Didymodactylos carnosus]CAF3501029.1 unnamed protein product [Didymodactylos carnosus]CAF4015573.1 unnamed protein product [Didymodactylos carnosus]